MMAISESSGPRGLGPPVQGGCPSSAPRASCATSRRRGELDRQILDVFIEAKIYEKTPRAGAEAAEIAR